MKIQDFDFSLNLMRSLLWEHNTAARLESLIRSKDNWYAKNYTDFWNSFVRDVFDLRTANAFGLQIWSRILGLPLTVALSPDAVRRPAFGFGNVGTVASGFARASEAWFIDNNGVLQHSPVNTPRYMGPNQSGMLREGAGENLWKISYDFSGWTDSDQTNTNISKTTGIPDPLGGNNATRVASLKNQTVGMNGPFNVTGQPVQYHVTAGVPVTFSVMVRPVQGCKRFFISMPGTGGGGLPTACALMVDLTTGQILLAQLVSQYKEGYVIPMANGWYRLGITAIPTATGWCYPNIVMQNAVIGDAFDVFGYDVKAEYGLSSFVLTDGTHNGIRAAETVTASGNTHKNFNNGDFSNSNGGNVTLTVEQQRILLRLRYFQLVSRCTTGDINRICSIVFKDMGKVYVLDRNDMSYLLYVFDFSPGSQLSFLLEHYDMMPRPAGVGVQYNIVTRKTFGFEDFHVNYNRGNFRADPTNRG